MLRLLNLTDSATRFDLIEISKVKDFSSIQGGAYEIFDFMTSQL